MKKRLVGQVAAIGLGTLIVGGSLGWAGATVLTPPNDVLSTLSYTYVEATQGEVSSSLALNAVAEWDQSQAGANQAQGVVTTIALEAGAEVGQGAVLYTTNLRPTVAAAGSIPAFRTLQRGDRGPDVGQLQEMLKSLGHFAGEVDSSYNRKTVEAVRNWQKSLGVVVDGIVQLGDVVFVPALPARLSLDAELVEVGTILVGGEKIVKGLSESPLFSISATEAQATLIPQGTRVEIAAPNGKTWDARAVDRETGEDGEVMVRLEGPDATAVCGEDCGLLSVTGQTLLAARVITVESVAGIVLPTASVRSSSDGDLSVIDEEGMEHPVTISATAKGMSLVEGIPTGLRVRVPAGPE